MAVYKLTREKQKRNAMIKRLLDNGCSQTQIADMLGIRRQSVHELIAKYIL